MKVGKIILAVVLAVMVVFGAVVFIALQNLNTLVKTAVETVGPQVTQTEVTLDEASFQLAEGRGVLSGLTIGNPTGFSSEYALKTGEVVLQVDPMSLRQPVIVIDEVRITGAKLIAEQKDLLNSNLQVLLKNIQSLGGKNAGKEGEWETSAKESQEKASHKVRLMVERFTFENASVRVVSQAWGERTISVPDVEVQDIGDRQTGLTPDQLTRALLQPVIDAARQKVTRELKETARGEAEEKLKEKLEEKLDEEQKEKLRGLKEL